MATTKGTLLFVDDEPSFLLLLRRLFSREGYQVLIANSGQEGIEILEYNQVDIIISDMIMPEMDGAEFLKIASNAGLFANAFY